MPTTNIYHITNINNLASILNCGGLIAYNTLQTTGINYTNIAHQNIQYRRATTNVPCSAGGTLHDYVPFYFAPRSPMLYTIRRGNVAGYAQGQNSVIHLVSTAQAVQTQGLAFAFTDGHAVMAYAGFYDSLANLPSAIDWQLMNSDFWFDTPQDPNRKCRRQAEFLVHQFCPWTLIAEIGVINNTIQAEVVQILQSFNQQTPVRVYSSWYFS